MSKTPEEMAEEYANDRCGTWEECENDNEWEEAKRGFLAGYKAAEEKYKAQIKELEIQLENWQHNAVHGDEGL